MYSSLADTLKQRVLSVDAHSFEALALDIFRYQATHNQVYKQYLACLKTSVAAVTQLTDIPFLPIEFFKTQAVVSDAIADTASVVFESSGTTGQETSKHFVKDPAFYLKVATQIFEKFYGSLKEYQIVALLPSYLERTNASLVYMVQHFIEQSGHTGSGFYLHEYALLRENLRQSLQQNPQQKILLIGVTFGLLDLVESGLDFRFLQEFSQVIVMETGGMKGRRKEMIREEVHALLCAGLHVPSIHSEYGMTELLSQGYSQGEGIFTLPDSMRIMLRDVNDPFCWLNNSSRSGGINVIDLANVDSCAFIETKDLGAFVPGQAGAFRILGRFDNADIRGCNLMVL